MATAIIIAKTKLRLFLRITNFVPNSFFSRGKVTTPTIVRVVIKATMGMIPAPAPVRDPARGKATKAGIRVILPIRAKTTVAKKVSFFTRKASRLSGGIRVRIRPIISRIATISPPMLFIIPVLIFTECMVFFLSLKIEKKNHIRVITHRTRVKISI